MWTFKRSVRLRATLQSTALRPARISARFLVLLQCGIAATAQPSVPERVVPIASLRTEQFPSGTRVIVQGVITRAGLPLYLQDRSGGLEVMAELPGSAFQIGDEVRVTGVPALTRYSSSLQADGIRLVHARIPDPPVAITPGMGASGEYDRLLIDTEGVLQRTLFVEGRPALLLHADHQSFLAQMPEQYDSAAHLALRPGSRLRVHGVCVMSEEGFPYPVAFRVLLRSAQDVTLLEGPPFWTREHLLWVCVAALFIAYAVFLFLRRFERWRFGLILDERTRLAHDLHDTLAQSFAGIAFQLQAIRSAVRRKESDGDIDQHVELAIGMVSHSHEDARRSIAMLKPAQSFDGDLLRQLSEQAEMLTRGGDIRVEVVTSGEPPRIEPAVQNALLRIGHEAITNTVRHASASLVTISLRDTQESIFLTITDNGRGLERRPGKTRGFGLSGMEARAASCGGSVTITPAAGGGCTVEAMLPHHNPRKDLRHWLILLLKGQPHAFRPFKSL